MEAGASLLDAFLGRLAYTSTGGGNEVFDKHPQIAKAMARLLPFLALSDPFALAKLCAYYKPILGRLGSIDGTNKEDVFIMIMV